MADEQDIVETPPELEAQAREMGWRPKEEFKGDESRWVDAKTFVDRGEHVLPIIKATNERLRGEIVAANQRTAQLEQAIKDSQETIAALERYHQDDVKQKVEKARNDLKAQLIQAKRDGDVEAEVNLTEELANLNSADAAALARDEGGEKKVDKQPPPKDYTKEPEFVNWKADNSWFGSDRAKTAIAYDITQRLREAGDTTVGRAFLDKVTVEVNKELARLSGGRPTNSRVEGGKGGAGGNAGGGRAKGYDDLPAEAKKACDDFSRDLVGPNRRYKTVDDWRKSYVTQYFTEV